MIQTALVVLLLTATTEAFLAPPPKRASVVVVRVLESGHTGDDEALARLQHEYKVLQEKLLLDVVVKHDSQDAERVEEQMLEVAAQAIAVQEHKLQTNMEQAGDELYLAAEDKFLAHSLKEKALEDALEEGGPMNAALEDLERLNDLELSYDQQELEAKHKIEAANILLGNLKENEAILMETLAKLREEKASEGAHKHEASKHRSFLDKIKDSIYAHPDLLAGMDPHIL